MTRALLPHLQDFKHLKIGTLCRVVKAFTDYDRRAHPVGETWHFEGHSFLPYDDGLSLFFSIDGSELRQIRMQLRPEEQGPVIDALESHIQPVREDL